MSFCIWAAVRRIRWRVLGLIIKTAEIGLFVCNPKELTFSASGKMRTEVGRQEGDKERTGEGGGGGARGGEAQILGFNRAWDRPGGRPENEERKGGGGERGEEGRRRERRTAPKCGVGGVQNRRQKRVSFCIWAQGGGLGVKTPEAFGLGGYDLSHIP